MECLDCKVSKIPEGHTGQVFLQCEDRAGHFLLCSHCWRKRNDEIKQAELDQRRRTIEEESRVPSKKKKSSRRGGSNRQGSSH
jgi:hypothetical protein